MSKIKDVKLGDYSGKGYAEIVAASGSRKSCNGIVYFENDPGEIVGNQVYSGVVYDKGNQHFLEFEVNVTHKNITGEGKVEAHFTANSNPFNETQK